jgi:hypothetical protein
MKRLAELNCQSERILSIHRDTASIMRTADRPLQNGESSIASQIELAWNWPRSPADRINCDCIWRRLVTRSSATRSTQATGLS